MRILQQHNEDARKADTYRPIDGIKGYSVVSLIPLFHIIRCFPSEYLHSVLEGVVKLFVSAFFNHSNSTKEWYLGKEIHRIDDKIKNMKPPPEVTRTPRSLRHLDKWKALEWRTFL